WSWSHDDSVHLRPWPAVEGLGGDPAVLAAASSVLTAIRRAKTDAKASQKTPARSALVTAPAELVASLRLAAGDLAAVGRIATLDFAEGDALAVGIELETEA
ncbi:valine--tRNA ligase, partial [Rathayibacter sp. AY1E1]